MVIFFYGEDDYRLKQAVKKLKEKFISASLGDTNLSIIDGKTAEYNNINRQIMAMPFLSKTRLVIIENIISEGKKETQEKIVEMLSNIPKTTVLLFTEGKADKRTALYKKLIKVEKVQEFLPLDDIKIKSWIKKEVENRGGFIESDAVQMLFEYVGSDLWRMANEIDKLTAYSMAVIANEMKQSNSGQIAASPEAPRNDIRVADIELLVKSQVESDIFKMIDAIGNKNLKVALRENQKLLENGQHELYILTMIVYQYRNLLIVKDSTERRERVAMHPYVYQKTLAQSRNFTMDDLKKDYQTLLDFDIAIKTGKMESRVALSLLIAKFCV